MNEGNKFGICVKFNRHIRDGWCLMETKLEFVDVYVPESVVRKFSAVVHKSITHGDLNGNASEQHLTTTVGDRRQTKKVMLKVRVGENVGR